MMLIFLLMSCQTGSQQGLEVNCDPAVINYKSVGQPFLRTYCTGCHSSHLDGDYRYGAPGHVNFDRYDQAAEWAQRSYIRSVHLGDMPPSGGIPLAEKELFTRWALCGAVGEELDVSIGNKVTEGGAHISVVLTEQSERGENFIELHRTIEAGGFDDARLGLYTVDVYQFINEDAYLHSYQLYKSPHELSREVHFDPPLPILDMEMWEQSLDVQATIWEEGQEWTEQQSWDGMQQLSSYLESDAHERDVEPLESVWISNTGEERGWRFSKRNVLSSQWAYQEDNYGWEVQQFDGIQNPDEENYFSLRPMFNWVELMLEREGE